MAERTPEATLYVGEPVVILSPLWTPRPVYHDTEYRWPDEPPTITAALIKAVERADCDITDPTWLLSGKQTRCGITLHATWWAEDDRRRVLASHTYDIDRSIAELRYEHARCFARPCRRCWPDTPPER